MSMLSMGSAGQGELQAMWNPGRSQQQQQQHEQAASMDSAATARPVVRSALMNQPPQRRAHMLLQEMAGLANRLVEIAGEFCEVSLFWIRVSSFFIMKECVSVLVSITSREH